MRLREKIKQWHTNNTFITLFLSTNVIACWFIYDDVLFGWHKTFKGNCLLPFILLKTSEQDMIKFVFTFNGYLTLEVVSPFLSANDNIPHCGKLYSANQWSKEVRCKFHDFERFVNEPLLFPSTLYTSLPLYVGLVVNHFLYCKAFHSGINLPRTSASDALSSKSSSINTVLGTTFNLRKF